MEKELPNAVREYLDADFSNKGEAWNKLLLNLDKEASVECLRLNGAIGPEPRNLTPAMRSWYFAEVRNVRMPALNAVESKFRDVHNEQVGPAIFLERRIDKIKDTALKQKQACVRSAKEQKATQYAKLDTLRSTLRYATERYSELVGRHSREAKLPAAWYVPALGLIGVFEAFINFETFDSLSWMTPIIAAGTTGIIALALAFASHFHGTFFRQMQTTMGPDRKEGDRAAAWRQFALGSLCLSLVLSVVFYARSQYLTDLIREATILGGEVPNSLWIIGGSLLSNMLVWILGVVVAFMNHDVDPNFPEAYYDRKKAETEFQSLDHKLNKSLQADFKRIDAKAEKDQNQAEAQHGAHLNAPAVKSARDLVQVIQSKDAHVVACLNEYQNQLAHRGRESGLRLELVDDVREDLVTRLEMKEYESREITLKYK